jgi:hypothetical protein
VPDDRCPGQDQRFWKPEDITECRCPHCGDSIEFWKDDIDRPCPHCGRRVANPRFDGGCAAWCRYADRCAAAGRPATGPAGKEPAPEGP